MERNTLYVFVASLILGCAVSLIVTCAILIWHKVTSIFIFNKYKKEKSNVG